MLDQRCRLSVHDVAPGSSQTVDQAQFQGTVLVKPPNCVGFERFDES